MMDLLTDLTNIFISCQTEHEARYYIILICNI